MHDIDRTLLEFDPETDQDDVGLFSEREEEYDDEDEYDDEYGYELQGEDESEAGYYEDEVFDEAEVEGLAAELLGATDDQELEQFLGKLVRRASRKVRRAVKSKTGRALRRILRKAAKRALPMVGSAAGTAFGGPIGGAVGGPVASGAGRAFGLELEGLSPEDQEFEVAKQVVRLASSATKKAATKQTRLPEEAAAKAAIVSAAKKHAPGLLRPGLAQAAMPSHIPASGKSGRWVRRGSKVVLLGI